MPQQLVSQSKSQNQWYYVWIGEIHGSYLNIIPILTPILLIWWTSVKAETQAGGKLTRVPEKNPYNTANTTNPCQVDIPSQPKSKVLVAITVGISTFIGPKTSAIMFGNIRPNTDAAYHQLRILKGKYIHHGKHVWHHIRKGVNFFSIRSCIKERGINPPKSQEPTDSIQRVRWL